MTLNEQIKRYCDARGLEFKPWEWPRPWDVEDDEPCAHPKGTACANWWPKMMAMRRKIAAELEKQRGESE